MSVSVTLIVALIGSLSPSNQIAPTPNCQLGSELPARMRVLRATVGAGDRRARPELTPGSGWRRGCRRRW